MKIKLLLVSAIAIVGMAVYTLTLSFTNTTPLLSQLEALASGEGGESGGDGSESGNTGGESGEGTEGENPESGGQTYDPYREENHCKYVIIETDPKTGQELITTVEKKRLLIKGCPTGGPAQMCRIEHGADFSALN